MLADHTKLNHSLNMVDYPIPTGLHAVPANLLDTRPDAEIDHDLLHPRPVTDEKNVWFFWHSGFANMHSYTQRNVRAWYRRFSKQGWAIRVLDRQDGSPLNVANYLDVHDNATFPKAFVDGRIGGSHAPQHTSDLVRFPLLIKYGGVYADVGLMQIGDLDRLWSSTLGNPSSPYEVLSYDGGVTPGRSLMNYFLCSTKGNPLFSRCHRLLLQVWGDKTSTHGTHADPLVSAAPSLSCQAFEHNGKKYTAEEATNMLTDYIIQGQVIALVMGLVDEEDGWNGPEYCAKHVYAIEFMVGAQLINDLTAWDGQEAFRLLSLSLPRDGEEESDDQKKARNIVESCLQKSFGFKLAHGMIIMVMGETLGSLWRAHPGADDVPGTYAHWLRYGIANWNQDAIPETVKIEVGVPFKTGPLLRVS